AWRWNHDFSRIVDRRDRQGDAADAAGAVAAGLRLRSAVDAALSRRVDVALIDDQHRRCGGATEGITKDVVLAVAGGFRLGVSEDALPRAVDRCVIVDLRVRRCDAANADMAGPVGKRFRVANDAVASGGDAAEIANLHRRGGGATNAGAWLHTL